MENNLNITVISDNLDLAKFVCKTLKKNKSNNVKLRFSANNLKKSEFSKLGGTPIDFNVDSDLQNLISESELIISAHCKKIFPAQLVDSVRCINIHPGYNPINLGWFPQVFSILNEQVAGATIHVMTRKVDSGPIIDREEVSIEFHENSYNVYQKIVKLEKKLFRKNLTKILDHNFKGFDVEEGKFNTLGNFRSLCALNLNSVNTLDYHIRLLKSLTFPGYKNGYVIVNNMKYFIEVKITPDDSGSAT